MLRDPRLWVGVALGAAAAWWWQRRARGQLHAATPYMPRPLTRKPRRGGGWPGSPNAGASYG